MDKPSDLVVQLHLCNNLACTRDDHFICPCIVCCLLFHPVIVSRSNETTLLLDSKEVDVIVRRCKDRACFSSLHVRCPSCSASFHTEINFGLS